MCVQIDLYWEQWGGGLRQMWCTISSRCHAIVTPRRESLYILELSNTFFHHHNTADEVFELARAVVMMYSAPSAVPNLHARSPTVCTARVSTEAPSSVTVGLRL